MYVLNTVQKFDNSYWSDFTYFFDSQESKTTGEDGYNYNEIQAVWNYDIHESGHSKSRITQRYVCMVIIITVYHVSQS